MELSRLYYDEFPGCCGVYILSDFAGIKSAIDEDIRRALNPSQDDIEDYGPPVNILAILRVGQQVKSFEPLLMKYGFRILHEGMFNWKHSSSIKLYIWEPEPEKAPGNPSFKKRKYSVNNDGYVSEIVKAPTKKKKK